MTTRRLLSSIALMLAAGCGEGLLTVSVKIPAFTMPVKSTFTAVCYQRVTPADPIGTVQRMSLRMDGTYYKGETADPGQVSVVFYARLTDPAGEGGAISPPGGSVVCVQPGAADVAISSELTFADGSAQRVELSGEVLARGVEQASFWTGAAVTSSTTPVLSDSARIEFAEGVATVTLSP